MTNRVERFSPLNLSAITNKGIKHCKTLEWYFISDMEGSTTVPDATSAVKNGICNGEVDANATEKANGDVPKKSATKLSATAQGKSRLGIFSTLLGYAWFIVKCLLCYAVALVVVPPLVPLIVVYYILKMVERIVVSLTSGDIALEGLDALWQQNSEENKLVINGLVYAENKSNSFEDALADFRQTILDRLLNAKKTNGELVYPRARCAIRPGFFQYFFQKDKHFRIENHVFKWEGEVPTSKEELASIVSKMSNESFRKGVSPWYFCCVPTNYGDKDFASVFRMSHSVADGVSLARFLIDQLPDQTTPQNEPQKFQSTGRTRELLLAKALLITPLWLIKQLLSFADQSILHGPKLSGTKKVVWHETFELKLIKEIKTATGTTVNDVLMSCLSRAIRKYFQRKGVDNPRDFTASIPVDVRSSASQKEVSFRNAFSLVFLKLAVATEDVLEQLYETKARMDLCKFSGEPMGAAAVMYLSNELCPEFLIGRINTFMAQKASCVLSNVPGPQHFLTVNGQRVKYMIFWPPQRDNIGVGLSIYSYAGQVIVGVQSDVAVLPDPEIITEEFGNAVNEMAQRVLPSNGTSNGHALQ